MSLVFEDALLQDRIARRFQEFRVNAPSLSWSSPNMAASRS